MFWEAGVEVANGAHVGDLSEHEEENHHEPSVLEHRVRPDEHRQHVVADDQRAADLRDHVRRAGGVSDPGGFETDGAFASVDVRTCLCSRQ